MKASTPPKSLAVVCSINERPGPDGDVVALLSKSPATRVSMLMQRNERFASDSVSRVLTPPNSEETVAAAATSVCAPTR